MLVYRLFKGVPEERCFQKYSVDTRQTSKTFNWMLVLYSIQKLWQ